jgi:hypothetical protein
VKNAYCYCGKDLGLIPSTQEGQLKTNCNSCFRASNTLFLTLKVKIVYTNNHAYTHTHTHTHTHIQIKNKTVDWKQLKEDGDTHNVYENVPGNPDFCK